MLQNQHIFDKDSNLNHEFSNLVLECMPTYDDNIYDENENQNSSINIGKAENSSPKNLSSKKQNNALISDQEITDGNNYSEKNCRIVLKQKDDLSSITNPFVSIGVPKKTFGFVNDLNKIVEKDHDHKLLNLFSSQNNIKNILLQNQKGNGTKFKLPNQKIAQFKNQQKAQNHASTAKIITSVQENIQGGILKSNELKNKSTIFFDSKDHKCQYISIEQFKQQKDELYHELIAQSLIQDNNLFDQVTDYSMERLQEISQAQTQLIDRLNSKLDEMVKFKIELFFY